MIITSNRLPVQIFYEKKKIIAERSTGGLVTAMEPVLKAYKGLWLGSTGSENSSLIKPELERMSIECGFSLHSLQINEEEFKNFYYGFSNEIIWPLFHDLHTRCNFVPDYWYTYLRVNEKFAIKTAELSNENDFVWIHDYHLMNVGRFIKSLGHKRKLAFFLHIPFPSIDIYSKLPWRRQIIEGLLAYDLVGFQTHKDRRNFLSCVKSYFPDCEISRRGSVSTIKRNGKTIKAGTFPISIDYEEFSYGAKNVDKDKCIWYLKSESENIKVILGLDRLDYTKGIPEKLNAFRDALQRFPHLVNNIVMLQLVIPSREDVPEYQELKGEIERLIGEINGEFSTPDWVPIHYFYQKLDRNNLFAFYRSSSIALITPLRDGMNLVAKEFCACNLNKDGALILSEFAGAASELADGAIIVNPYDIESVAHAINSAYLMDDDRKFQKMKKMQKKIRKNNIFKWVDSFIDTVY